MCSSIESCDPSGLRASTFVISRAISRLEYILDELFCDDSSSPTYLCLFSAVYRAFEHSVHDASQFIASLQLGENQHGLSRKNWNKLMHALNGNIKHNSKKAPSGGSSIALFNAIDRPSPLFPLPPSKKVILKYSERISRNLTATVTDDYQFRLNSPYDPNSTGAGSQPQGYDQMCTFYNRYRVLRAEWKLRFPSTPSSETIFACVANNDNGSFLTGVSNSAIPMIERCVSEVSASITAPITLRGGIDLWTLNGVSKAVYMASDRYEAQNNTNPTELAVLHVIMNAISSVTQPFWIEIVYEVEFFDPNQLALS
jgi:hypothetical protein